MNFPKIVFKIEDRIYEVDASDGPAIRKIPKEDRQHLMTLMLAIKKQDEQLRVTEAQETADVVPTPVTTPVSSPMQSASPVVKTSTPANVSAAKSHSENKENIDRLFEGLAAQERSGTKRITKMQMYIILSVVSSLILFIFSIL